MTHWLTTPSVCALITTKASFVGAWSSFGLHVVADGLIFIACLTVALAILYYVSKARDVPQPWAFYLLATLIAAAGVAHLVEIWAASHPLQGLAGGIKAATALLALATAVVFVRAVPQALALPSRRQLREQNEQLESRVRIRTEALLASNEHLRYEAEQRGQAEEQVRRLNAALEQRVAELQALFDALPVGVGISRDAECNDIRTNRTFATVLGIKPDANASLSARDGTAPTNFRILADGHELAPHELPMQRAVRENREIHDFEETIRRDDGEQRHVSVTALPLRDEQGRATGAVATFHDVTARKAAEDELRLVIEAAPNAILKVDERGRITLVNSQALALFGYTREELLGQSVEILVPERLRAGHADRIAGFFAAPSARAIGGARDLFGRRKDGTEVPIEIGLNPIRTTTGTVALAAIVDMTHRKRAEKERLEFERRLLETQKLESIGVLAGGIAHDFNNLLTAILGNASLVRERLTPDQAQLRRQLQEVELAAQNAAGLCKQLLAYAGQGNFVVKPFALNPLITEHVPLLKLSISKMVDLKLELAEPLRLIRGDDSQLRQVLMNLVINASEAIGTRPGNLVIRTRLVEIGEEEIAALVAPNDLKPGWYVSLEVEDDGTGMSPETVTRIFEPFFTTKFIGRGLGLAALIGIVRRHHGGIRVDSTVGQGTRFQMLFPALDDSATPFPGNSRSSLAESPHGHGTVLVVDDEAYIRDLANASLTARGYDVMVATNGEEAIAMVKAMPARFAAVLLDLSMPKMDGESALLALRMIAPKLPVVLTSGFNEQAINKRFLSGGLAGFLPKPFTPNGLVSHIGDAIRRARQVG